MERLSSDGIYPHPGISTSSRKRYFHIRIIRTRRWSWGDLHEVASKVNSSGISLQAVESNPGISLQAEKGLLEKDDLTLVHCDKEETEVDGRETGEHSERHRHLSSVIAIPLTSSTTSLAQFSLSSSSSSSFSSSIGTEETTSSVVSGDAGISRSTPVPSGIGDCRIEMSEGHLDDSQTDEEPTKSFLPQMIFSCFAFWFCGFLFGLVGFVLAVTSSRYWEKKEEERSRRMTFISLGLSILGIVLGVVALVLFLLWTVDVFEDTGTPPAEETTQ